MKEYQPLVLRKLDIRVPGLRLRQLALHRHLPETTNVEPHAHGFCQCLAYLSGRGKQVIRGEGYPIETGSAVFLPPRVQHAFHRDANRRPVCLVVDFEWHAADCGPPRVVPLPKATLSEIRQQLARIARPPVRQAAAPALKLSATLLGIMDALLTELVFPRGEHPVWQSPVAKSLNQLFNARETVALPLDQIAHRVGYQQDYLNRLLKQHEGLTLGQLRARQLLGRSQQLLRGGDSVGAVAEAAGFNDPNYFSRWFRKHTGLTPTQWRASVAEAAGSP